MIQVVAAVTPSECDAAVVNWGPDVRVGDGQNWRKRHLGKSSLEVYGDTTSGVPSPTPVCSLRPGEFGHPLSPPAGLL